MPNPRAPKPLTLEQVKNDLQSSRKSPTGGAAFGFYPQAGRRGQRSAALPSQEKPFFDERAMELPQFGEVDLSVPTSDAKIPGNNRLAERMLERQVDLKRQADEAMSPLEKFAGGIQTGRLIGSALTQAAKSIPTAITKGGKAAEDYIAENIYKPTQPKAYEYAGDIGDFLEQLETQYKLPPILPEAVALQSLIGPATRQAGKAVKRGAEQGARNLAAPRTLNPQAGVFIGPKAKTFNQGRAAMAEAMEEAGRTPEEIWLATGTFRGKDGILRQEIDDRAAKFLSPSERQERIDSAKGKIAEMKEKIKPTPQKDLFPKALTEAKKEVRDDISILKSDVKQRENNPRTQGLLAQHIFEHPELYAAYPELQNVKIVTEGGSGNTLGALSINPSNGFYPGSMEMDIYDKGLRSNPTSTTLHEMQHAVQTLEGMGPGGNPTFAFSNPEAHEILKKLREETYKPSTFEQFQRINKFPEDEAQAAYEQYLKERKANPITSDKVERAMQETAAMEYYKRLLGEAEARATQDRQLMTPSQRMETPPPASYDVPQEDLIVKPPREYGKGGFVKGASKAAKSGMFNPDVAMTSARKSTRFDDTAPPTMSVIKERGGNWLGGSVEKALKPLKRSGGLTPQDITETEAHLEKIRPSYDLNNPRDARQLREMEDHVRALKANLALDNWVERNLGNYVKKEMATPEDPVRRLAEEGISHMPQNEIDYANQWLAESLAVARMKAGFSPQDVGVSNTAKGWERLADEMMNIAPASQHTRPLTPSEIRQGVKSTVDDNPWLTKVNPDTPIYYPQNMDTMSRDFGFDHIMDVLREDVTSGRIRPEQLSKVSMEQAVRRTAEYDQEMAKKIAEARVARREGLPVYKDYPEGYRWVELNKPGAFAAESEAMGHSVRGYEPPQGHPDWTEGSGDRGSLGYGHGGWEAIKSGKAKVYSLVDSKGEPHVTVEVGKQRKNVDPLEFFQSKDVPQSLLDKITEGEKSGMFDDIGAFEDFVKTSPEYQEYLQSGPSRITQIKGKQNEAPNEAYLPFVQDFVKSGQWADVGDLGNTGLFKLGDEYMTEAEAAAKYKPMTQEALNFLETHPAFEQHRAAQRALNKFEGDMYSRQLRGDVYTPEYRELENAAGSPVSENVPYTIRELQALLTKPEEHTHRNGSIYEPISLAIEKLNQAKKELGIDLPLPEEGMARGGRVHISDNPDVMALELAGGGLVRKGIKAIKGAAESAGQKAPVLAEKDLTTLQDFHTSLGDSVRQRVAEANKMMEGFDYKYDKGQRVFTKDSAAKNKPPYTILSRTRVGNQVMREDMNDLMSKKIIDPETGKAMRTPYEPGYRVRMERGPDDWHEFDVPASAIVGDVEMAAGGLVKGIKAAKAAMKTPQKAVPIVEAPSIMVPSSLSQLKEAIRQSKGEYGARRVQRAADEIPNLERLYKEQALREAFGGDNAKALMTMNPADFERYAKQLEGRTPADIGPKMSELAKQGEIDKYTVPTDEYIQHLMRLQGGFDDVPYLNLYKDEVGLPSYPEIKGHEGRHRNRALAAQGEESSLVQISPRGDLREGLPRRSQEEFIEALKEELGRSNQLVYPEADPYRPPIRLPDPYAAGGAVKMAAGGIRRLAKAATDVVKPNLVIKNKPGLIVSDLIDEDPEIAKRLGAEARAKRQAAIEAEGKRKEAAKQTQPSVGYRKSTPQNPDPLVGTRFINEAPFGLNPNDPFDLSKYKGGSGLVLPWDSQSRNVRTTQVSGLDLPNQIFRQTHGGVPYSFDTQHAAKGIVGASGEEIAKRVKTRSENAIRENKDRGGTGELLHFPITMGYRGEDYALPYSEFSFDIINYKLMTGELTQKQADELTNMVRNYTPPEKKYQGKKPFSEFAGFTSPEGLDQIYTGQGLKVPSGELRKAIADRIIWQKGSQEKLGFNAEDLMNATTYEPLRGVDKGFIGSSVMRNTPSGMRLSPSAGKYPYDTDFSGEHLGRLEDNVNVEALFYRTLNPIKRELMDRETKKPYTREGLSRAAIAAIEKRNENVSQMIDQQFLDDYDTYITELKKPTEYRKGGAVRKYAAGGAITADDLILEERML